MDSTAPTNPNDATLGEQSPEPIPPFRTAEAAAAAIGGAAVPAPAESAGAALDVPAAPAQPAPESAPAHREEEKTMASNFDYNRMSETVQNQAQQFQSNMADAAEQARSTSEEMMRQGQQAFQQASERSREAMDRGMKALDEFNATARGNADAWLASSRAAAQGLEQIVQQAAEFSRKTFESATAAMRTMAQARTPTDVMSAQNDFAKQQFDHLVGEFSRLTETMMKVTTQVFEPIQNQMAESAQKASDSMKSMVDHAPRA